MEKVGGWEWNIENQVGNIMDITDRRRTEEALRQSEEKFRLAFHTSPDSITLSRLSDGMYIDINEGFTKLTGYTRKDAIGRTSIDLNIWADPRDREQLASDLLNKGCAENLEARFRRKDGQIGIGLMSARVLRLNQQEGKPIKVIEEFMGRTFETLKFPILHPGKPSMLAGFTIDITERITLETQLRQAQKMEAIGTLAGGIAHDFNNILGVIVGNAQLLEIMDRSFLGKDEINQILNASKRAKQLVRQILAFSRQGEQEKLLVGLKPVVKETLEFLRSSLPATIHLQHSIKADVGTIMADPTQMQQVIMNLCTNAAHAMEKQGGVLKIDLENMPVAEEDVQMDFGVEPGEYVRLTVSDTGHGIEPDLLPRIFDPYFTTKGPDKGTGLGLSVVHGIIKFHKGGIKVISEVGKGTAFQVIIPKVDGIEEKEEKSFPKLPMGDERILVVDDEKQLVEMHQRMLGLLGYRVESRTSPVEAIEAVRGNPQKFDLVITDMTMPQMTGYNLARELMEIRPGLPVILCTGFSDQVNEEKARSVGILAFLLKPVLLHDLANTLRKTLDQAGKKGST